MLDDAGALRLAADIEGHPDNVAPCLLGGFTIAWTEASGGAGRAAGDRRRRTADGFRSRRTRPDRHGAGRAAGGRAARGRRVQRRPGGAAGARADHRSVAAASRRPRTGCTRTTGRRGCRGRRRWSRRCARSGWRQWSVGPGPTVLALTAPYRRIFDPGTEWRMQALRVDVTGALPEGLCWNTPSGPLLPQVGRVDYALDLAQPRSTRSLRFGAPPRAFGGQPVSPL